MILTFALAFIAGLNSFARPGRLDAIASLNASTGLDALDTLASLNALSAFVGVNALDALARLGSLHMVLPVWFPCTPLPLGMP